jgi:N-acetylmuramic acid 6-phosphate (MurNAc-6-P) etherase
LCVIDADVLVGMVFSGLTALTINGIEDAGEVIVVVRDQSCVQVSATTAASQFPASR